MNHKKMLELCDLALAFRRTPIVDDDFALMRDHFDLALAGAMDDLCRPRPLIVCLCGSTRFADAYRDAMRTETLAGKIVLSVGLLGHQEGIDMDGPVKAMLDELHLRKIDLADEVLVLNCRLPYCEGCVVFDRSGEPRDACPVCRWAYRQRPYVGESTRREIAYAEGKGKRVRYLNPPE